MKFNVKKIDTNNSVTLSTVCKKQSTAENRLTRFLESYDRCFTETMLRCFMHIKTIGYVNGELVLQAVIEENDYTMCVQISGNTYIVRVEFHHDENTTETVNNDTNETAETDNNEESDTPDTTSDTNNDTTEEIQNIINDINIGLKTDYFEKVRKGVKRLCYLIGENHKCIIGFTNVKHDFDVTITNVENDYYMVEKGNNFWIRKSFEFAELLFYKFHNHDIILKYYGVFKRE